MTRLTEHFTLEELTFSETAQKHKIDNTPNSKQYRNLLNLAVFLEKVRAYVSSPLVISSGFRSEEVNALVGGRKKSDHLDGRAADTKCSRIPIKQYFELLADSDLAYDKIIIEYGRWVHISIPEEGKTARRLKLIIEANGERAYG